MSDKRVENKPSETALFAALHRAIANKEYKNNIIGPDYLAEYFLPFHFRFFLKFKRVRANVKKRLNEAFPGLHEFVIARTAWFDKLFTDALKDNIPQIVLLGAGYDSRAYRFVELNKATKIIELDIAPTQNRKTKCLKNARIDVPSQVSLIPIDFNQESLINVLETAGYENSKKTLFIWEGVSYYLESQTVDETLEFIGHTSHDESMIAFDYAISISEENINLHGVKEFSQSMKEHHSDERLLFSIAEEKIKSYLELRGLNMIQHMDNKEIESTFLTDEIGSSIGPITGHFRFVLASPG